MFPANDGKDMGHGAAMAGEDDFFAGLHLVQQLTQMRLRLSQIDSDQSTRMMTRKLDII